MVYGASYFGNQTNNLVPGNHREDAFKPLIPGLMNVAVANP
jgi:hypothetical protein